ncbi:S8 family serine peptidase [Dyella tabacisoli]|uniref:Fervidolysin-like N-terminal prodomain domain-containing protein n=1 Tax=Dyella tabacisoli TaxID=2282381 RepID=A0A369UK35_9GAMM|nr:hypothetical protein [Dyella tabacisoli]RDD80906.1 hypothetical protein DVJ77_14450 [Dyella tabacisoli]
MYGTQGFRVARLAIPLLLTLPIFSACAYDGAPPMPAQAPGASQIQQGARLIVTYKDAPDSDAAKAANRSVGARMLRPVSGGHAAVVELPPGAAVASAMTKLKAQPGVVYVEVDSLLRADPIRGPRIGD